MVKRVIIDPVRLISEDGRVNALLLSDYKIKVLKGSFFRKDEVNSTRIEVHNKRQYLINNDYVKNGQYVKDYIFDDPSMAISASLGRMETGQQFFKTVDGIDLRDYLEVDEITSYELKKEAYKNKRFLVCNVTWMEKYQGKEPVSETNWGFVKEHGFGYELFNFYNKDGFMYGYTEMHKGSITLKKIESGYAGDSIDDVLVVWISRDPSGKLTIVGYYKSAIVFSKRQTKDYDQEYPWYFIKAKADDTYLIPLEERTFIFPKERKNRPGESSIWYGDNIDLRIAIIDYVNSIDNSRIHFHKIRQIIENDDDFGVVSTNDIDKEVEVHADYTPAKKPEKVKGSTSSFKRNEAKAKKAIMLSNYKCNLYEGHESFISKNGKAYMEAHHLIPINAQDDFSNSLDCDANIVCLCPNCHRMLHYGQNIEDSLKKIYDLRKEHLKESGIDISFEDLLKYYE